LITYEIILDEEIQFKFDIEVFPFIERIQFAGRAVTYCLIDIDGY
jgi:hypothetical protein